jgi:hypothetical protein
MNAATQYIRNMIPIGITDTENVPEVQMTVAITPKIKVTRVLINLICIPLRFIVVNSN